MNTAAVLPAETGAEPIEIVHAAAQAGIADAQAMLGQLLLDGNGVAQDRRVALDWFVRAAAQRHVMALNMVGRCYDLGWGTPVDKHRAAECYRVAAARALPEAMYNYATLLALGDGVAEDRAAALGWLERAAAMGFAKADNFVGSFAEDGWAGPRDMTKAADCYARAAAGGDFRGCFNHARMLAARGDTAAAASWIGRAAVLGHDRFVGQMTEWLERCGDARLRAAGLAAIREAQAC